MALDPEQAGPPPLTPWQPHLAQQLEHAIVILTGKASAASGGAEAKDFAAAVESLAGAAVTLDPTRLAGGDMPHARKASMPDPAVPATKDGDHDGQVGE